MSYPEFENYGSGLGAAMGCGAKQYDPTAEMQQPTVVGIADRLSGIYMDIENQRMRVNSVADLLSGPNPSMTQAGSAPNPSTQPCVREMLERISVEVAALRNAIDRL